MMASTYALYSFHDGHQMVEVQCASDGDRPIILQACKRAGWIAKANAGMTLPCSGMPSEILRLRQHLEYVGCKLEGGAL